MSITNARFSSIAGVFVFYLMVSVELLAIQVKSAINPEIIKVSNQTTFITEPLTAKGLPDYRRWLLERQRSAAREHQGLNGAIPFWQACWPADLSKDQEQLLREELGAALPDHPGPFSDVNSKWHRPLVDEISEWIIRNWRDKNPRSTDEQVDKMERFAGRYADRIMGDAWTRPFKAADRPMIAEWIQKHKPGFDLIDAAAACDYFYSPSPSFLQSEGISLVDIKLTFENWIRYVHRAISMRTNLMIGEGDYRAAWNSCLTGIRLAKITNPKDFLFAIEVMTPGTHFALNEIRQLAIQPEIPLDLLWEIHEELERLFPEFSRARGIHIEARLSWLEIAIQWSQGIRPNCFDGNLPIFPEQLKTVARPDIDWNLLLEYINESIDELVAVGDVQGREKIERHNLLIEQWWVAPIELPFGISPSILSREARTVLTRNMLLKHIAILWSYGFESESRLKSEYELTKGVIALAIYRKQHGEYPDTFDQVVPAILNAVPVDHYCGCSLQYRRTEDGFLLYSMGVNGIDDQADNHFREMIRGFDFSLGGVRDYDQLRGLLENEVDLPPEPHPIEVAEDSDDISVRFPLPHWRLPDSPN